MDALPMDMLVQILGKVDKYEHLKMLLATFTREELPQLQEIIKSVCDKRNQLRQDIFNELKQAYRTMERNNKKGKAPHKKMLMEIEIRPGEVVNMEIACMGRKYIHAIERTERRTTRWTIHCGEKVKKYYEVDCEGLVE
jgi:hypothetical protein